MFSRCRYWRRRGVAPGGHLGDGERAGGGEPAGGILTDPGCAGTSLPFASRTYLGTGVPTLVGRVQFGAWFTERAIACSSCLFPCALSPGGISPNFCSFASRIYGPRSCCPVCPFWNVQLFVYFWRFLRWSFWRSAAGSTSSGATGASAASSASLFAISDFCVWKFFICGASVRLARLLFSLGCSRRALLLCFHGHSDGL